MALIVPGLPPAGTKASALTRLCIVFRARMPSSVSQVCRTPLGPNCIGDEIRLWVIRWFGLVCSDMSYSSNRSSFVVLRSVVIDRVVFFF